MRPSLRLCHCKIFLRCVVEPFGENWWTYDGVCPNLEVYGVMLNLGGLPKFKSKATKMAPDDFQDLIGSLGVSIRYVFFVVIT